MPIFDIVLRMPFLTAVMYWSVELIDRHVSAADRRRACSLSMASKARYGLIGVGPVAAQQAEVHHLARLAAFDDDARLAPQPPLQQAVVQRRGGQQAGNRRLVGRDVAVADDQQRRPVADRPLGRVDQLVQRLRAGASPGSASSASNSAGSVTTLKSSRLTVRSRSMSSLVRIGCGSLSCRQCSGVSSSRFRCLPVNAISDITSPSRSGSIGGLVTWAKSCLK